MDKLQAIVNALKNMSDSDIVALWNERCEECNYWDDRIYYMQEFNDIECDFGRRDDESPLDLIDRVQSDFTDFDSSDDYFAITIYGYESFNTLDAKASPYDETELAEAIMDGKVDVTHYDELNEIVNPEEDEDDEE